MAAWPRLSPEKVPTPPGPLGEFFRLRFFCQHYEDKTTSLPGRVGDG